MFTRFTSAIVGSFACSLLLACGDGAEFSPVSDAPEGAGPTLSVLGDTAINVAPRGEAQLRVLYVDRDYDGDGKGDLVGGVPVEFALVGNAKAVSLSPSQAVTDPRGEAVAQLTAGSDAASFRVRASALGAEPVFIEVRVTKSAVRNASISASYEGLRELVTRTIAALPGLGCAAARDLLASGMTGDLRQTYTESDGSKDFDLGPGLHYALIAWGSDARGGILADGCVEIDVPVDAEVAFDGVVVPLVDRSFKLAGSYEVTLELDVSRSAQRAGDTAVLGGQALLNTMIASAEADYLLDSIEAAMRGANNDSAAVSLATARSSGSIDASLQAALNTANVGPLRWLTQLGAELQERGSRLVLRADYGVTSVAGVPMSLTLRAMQSRTADASRSLSYAPMFLPMTFIDAQYDDARAVIAVDTIRIQLPLGTYASRLLDAIDASEKGGALVLLAGTSGCSELVIWAAKQPFIHPACDDNCVRAACDGATAALYNKARIKLSTLDNDHPSIGVRGELLVSDADSDGIVDALGTAAFEGSWGKAPKAEQADVVDADFSVISSTPAR